MANYPKISVLMSAYNSEEYIRESIDSILSQTLTDFEFIVINDGSSDSTRSIIESYKDKRIKLINNERNLGLAGSLNLGISIAKGKYLVRMDADDISMPERFQKQFSFMEQNQDVDVCGSFYETFGQNSFKQTLPTTDKHIRAMLFFYNCIAHPTVILRTETVVNNLIRYNDSYIYVQDYELWCRMIDTLRFANISEILLKYRTYDRGKGHEARNRLVNEALDSIFEQNLEKIGIELSYNNRDDLLKVFSGSINIDGSTNIYSMLQLLDMIGDAGSKRYETYFKDMITEFIAYVYSKGMENMLLEFKLYSILKKWGILSTVRSKLRFFYSCSFKGLL